MLIDGLQIGYVNGFGYNQVMPAPEAEIPERFQRAEQVFAQKLWREQLRDWDENRKPAAIATHRELQAVDPDALSDAELVAYLTRCRDHHAAMIAQHMRFTAGARGPDRRLPRARRRLDRPAAGRAARPDARLGAGVRRRLRRDGAAEAAFAEDPAAREALASDDDPAQVLARLRALGGEAGAAVSGYLDLVGNRLLDGFDIAEPTALELPDALLRAIRIAVSGEAQAASDVDARIAEVRAAGPGGAPGRVRRAARRGPPDLPAARRARRLQRHLGLGPHAARRPGRGPAGRGPRPHRRRRAHAGREPRRDVRAGRRHAAARRRTSSPRRADYRATHTAKDVPPFLGPPPPPPPDLAALPPAVGRADARDVHRPGPPLRELRGAARGEGPLRAGGEQGRLRRAGAPRLRPVRVRPDRQGRRARHRVDDRGLQHPPAAARRRSSPTTAACSRTPRSSRASTASPASSGPARRPSASPTASASASTAMPAKSRCSGEEGRPVRQGARDVALRVEGGGARRRRAPGPARSRPASRSRATSSRPSPRATTRRSRRLAKAIAGLPPPFAVRSSAVDEDGASASFAGQHLTVLNVHSAADVPGAVREVWWSANSDSAITYRQRVGLFTRPSVGVVVQTLLDPDVGRRHVHREPGHRRRRAPDRGELGPRRSGGRRARRPGPLPPRPRRPGAGAQGRAQAHRDPLAPERRHRSSSRCRRRR